MAEARESVLPSSGSRLQALDAIRGVAILLVIGHHASYRFEAAAWDPVARLLRSMGWIGVDMFFALSGFLIVSILLRDSSRGDILGFFRRRFFRIVPIFVVAVATFWLGGVLTGMGDQYLDRLWIPALMLTGWAIPILGVDAVPYTITWSLSVEEFAYLTLGFAGAFSTGKLRAAVLVSLVVAVVVRAWVVFAGTFPVESLYYFVPARLDAIALGGLGAMGVYGGLVGRRWAAAAAGIATGGLIVAYHWAKGIENFLPLAGYLLFGLACAVWVTAVARRGDRPNRWWTRSLASLGQVSYFVYLFHLFFLEALRLVADRTGAWQPGFWQGVSIAGLACYLVARLSWRFLESPLIEYGRRRPVALEQVSRS